MTNYGFTGFTLSKKMKKELVKNGGFQNMVLPIVNTHLSYEDVKIEFGGYNAIVNYNKNREIQYKIDKENRRMRRLKKQQKRSQLENTKNSYWSIGHEISHALVTHLNKEGGTKIDNN